jgi:hypothetical protein
MVGRVLRTWTNLDQLADAVAVHVAHDRRFGGERQRRDGTACGDDADGTRRRHRQQGKRSRQQQDGGYR